MRDVLQKAGFTVRHASHAGHAIARLLPQKQKGQEEANHDRLRDIVSRRVSPAYSKAFEAWKTYHQQTVTLSATTSGPLAIGLGNASPYEVGLTLHHTYGVPYLPGTALKGLARRVATANGIEADSEAFRVLFGDMQAAAHVIWWDGWMHADTQAMLQLDTITVHHPKYYRDGSQWPTDFDDPNPVTFLSVPAGVTFHLVLSGPTEWAHLAAQLLAHGLEHLGLGGKTNAGYGGFHVEREKSPTELETERLQQEAEAERLRQEAETKKYAARAEQYRKQIDGMNLGRADQDFRNLRPQLLALPKSVRDELFQALLNRLNADTRTKTNKGLLKSVRNALEAE